jgi:hypothetical protein
MLTALEEAALQVDPWGDGKGDDPYIVFRNQVVTARKAGQCALCFGVIVPGERVRAQTECVESKVLTFRFCGKCVRAMGRYHLHDEFKPLERRYALGRNRASRAPRPRTLQ